MVRARRRRHFVAPLTLVLLRPCFRYSLSRDAYVVRLIGSTHGPVLQRERRHKPGDYAGPERRHVGVPRS